MLFNLKMYKCLCLKFIATANNDGKDATLEELIFRVGMLPLLSQSVSLATATIPAAAIFGFVHFHGGFPNGWFGSLLLAYGGFMLGYLVIAQKGISAAVVWHMLMDMIILCFTFR